MSTGTATVLPFPRRDDGRGERSGRAGVRLEVTRRGRVLMSFAAFVLGLVVAAAVLLTFDVPSALAGSEADEGVTVTVEAGDTLWGYAEEYAPEGMSTQEFISEVRSLNQLPTGRVTAGLQIELPAMDTAGR